ncbi:glycosyltransferase family 4 protein [Thalassospira australica]|uniref:glycosyltransferase family 4 protein n=1 Tax=Thalassospira australica TaxID=1528106 RepID=UPI00051A7BCC|nr:glycosyltransferase family 4 protein [Thalassospira australica]
MTEQFCLAYLSPEPNREGHASFTHVQEIVRNLVSEGWQVDLFCPTYQESKLPGVLPRLVGIAGVLWRAALMPRPDVYYMRWHFAAWPLAFLAKIRNIPIVIEVNGPIEDLFIAWPITKIFKKPFAWLMETQLRWSDAIVAVTPGLTNLCRQICGQEKQVETIPNGANVDLFHPDAKFENNRFTDILPKNFLIFFGTMAPWQGIRTILKAVEDTAWPDSMHLVFAGDGEERDVIEDAVRRVGHVHYLGRVPYDQLPAIISRAKGSLVCAENIEGRASTGLAPLKLFESLASGIPVIATKQPYQAEIISQGKCGIEVEPGDPSALAKVVARLERSSDECDKWSRNARVVAVSGHSWLARAKQTDAVLRHVLRLKE